MVSTYIKVAFILSLCSFVLSDQVSVLEAAAVDCQPPKGCDFANATIWTPHPPHTGDSVIIEFSVRLEIHDKVNLASLDITSGSSIVGRNTELVIHSVQLRSSSALELYNSVLSVSDEIALKSNSAKLIAQGSTVIVDTRISLSQTDCLLQLQNSTVNATEVVIDPSFVSSVELLDGAKLFAAVLNVSKISAVESSFIEVNKFHIYDDADIKSTNWEFKELVVMAGANATLSKVPQSPIQAEDILVFGSLNVIAEMDINSLTIEGNGTVSLQCLFNAHSKIKKYLNVSIGGALRISSCYLSIGSHNETSYMNGTLILAESHVLNMTRIEIERIVLEPTAVGDLFFSDVTLRQPATIQEHIWVEYPGLTILGSLTTNGIVSVEGTLWIEKCTLTAREVEVVPHKYMEGSLRLNSATLNATKIYHAPGVVLVAAGNSRIIGEVNAGSMIEVLEDSVLDVEGTINCDCAMEFNLQMGMVEPSLKAVTINFTKNAEIKILYDEEIEKKDTKVTFVVARATDRLIGMPGKIMAVEEGSKKMTMEKDGKDIHVTVDPRSTKHPSHKFPGWAIFLIITSVVMALAASGYVLYLKKPHLFKRFTYATIEDNREL